MYPTITDCGSKCLVLLIHSTYDCTQRSSFVTVLAQSCFLFPTVESIQSETVFISQLIAGVDDNKLLPRLQQRVSNNNPNKVDIIQSFSLYMKTIAPTRKVTIMSRDNSRCYRVVVASIFYEHLKFAGQRTLSVIIFPPARKKKDDTTNQQTNSLLRVVGIKRKRYTSDMVHTKQYMTLESQLYSPIEPDMESTLETVQPEICSFYFNLSDNIVSVLYLYILFSFSLYLQSSSLVLQVTATITKDSKYNYDVLAHEENWTDNCLCCKEYMA